MKPKPKKRNSTSVLWCVQHMPNAQAKRNRVAHGMLYYANGAKKKTPVFSSWPLCHTGGRQVSWTKCLHCLHLKPQQACRRTSWKNQCTSKKKWHRKKNSMHTIYPKKSHKYPWNMGNEVIPAFGIFWAATNPFLKLLWGFAGTSVSAHPRHDGSACCTGCTG